MRLWIDDIRMAPKGYIWCKSVYAARDEIVTAEIQGRPYTLIDIDHDAGEYVSQGGDYIRLLDWLEETGRSYPIRIHSMNPVGVANMRAIIKKNGWEEV